MVHPTPIPSPNLFIYLFLCTTAHKHILFLLDLFFFEKRSSFLFSHLGQHQLIKQHQNCIARSGVGYYHDVKTKDDRTGQKEMCEKYMLTALMLKLTSDTNVDVISLIL